MADWRRWWREVRVMCDESPDGSVELTIEQILDGAGSSDHSVQSRWWWEMMMNPNAHSHTGVRENGMDCEPLPEGDVVERVVFRVPR